MKSTVKRVGVLIGASMIMWGSTACADGFTGSGDSRETVAETSATDLPTVADGPSSEAPASSSTRAPKSSTSDARVVEKDELEAKVHKYYVDGVDGYEVKDTTCDGDLQLNPGDTQECVLQVDDVWLPVTVTVKNGDGDVDLEVGDVMHSPPAFAE